jgi:hypothetical protein
VAIITKCSECDKQTSASVSNHWPLCDACKRKHGWKPWEEMSLEEKVENLNRRLDNTESRNAIIG